MFKLTLVAVSLLSTIVSVRGHGYVQEVVSGSAKYTGYLPYQDPYYNPPPQRIIRKIPGNGQSVYRWLAYVSHSETPLTQGLSRICR